MSKDALRMRVRRGTLESEKGEDGRVYVYLYDNHERDQDTVHPEHQSETSAVVEAKDETIRHLSEQLEAEREARRRADTIIAQLSQATAEQARTIRELEAPRDEQNQPESAEPQPDRGNNVPEEPENATERPWWRRVFGS